MASLEDTLSLMRDLRQRCEWDAAETHEALRPYLIEEAYEVDEAIRSGDDGKLREELGDLLLQVLFHAVVAEERGAFSMYDVADTFITKMKGRLEKVDEEIGEVRGELAGAVPNRERLQDELGDLLFAVVNLCRKADVHPALALDGANVKFARRFAAVEELAAERGITVGQASLAELDALWDEIKAGETT